VLPSRAAASKPVQAADRVWSSSATPVRSRRRWARIRAFMSSAAGDIPPN